MIRKTVLGLAAVAALGATAMTTGSDSANAGVKFYVGVPYYGGYYCGYYGCPPVYGGYYRYNGGYYWKHHKHWKHHKYWK